MAIVRGDIRLSVPLVLPDRRAVSLWVPKNALMEDHKLSIKARVYLQVLRCLHENRAKELIVEGVDRQARINHIIMIVDIVLENLLSIVSDEPIAIDPDQLGRYRNDSMTKLLVFVRWGYRLQSGKRSDIPDDKLVGRIDRVNEGAPLNDIDTDYRCSMAFQAAEMGVTKEVLRTPDIRENFEAS